MEWRRGLLVRLLTSVTVELRVTVVLETLYIASTIATPSARTFEVRRRTERSVKRIVVLYFQLWWVVAKCLFKSSEEMR